jgi:F-type H+-transporting ATPase subunit delta
MRISKQIRREAKQLFRCCLADGLLDAGRTRQAVQAVIERKPRGYLALLTHFKRLVQLDIEKRTARVESVMALPPPQQAAITANLTRRYGPGLELAFAVNPRLIGGLRIRVGSDVFDGTIRDRLNALQESF